MKLESINLETSKTGTWATFYNTLAHKNAENVKADLYTFFHSFALYGLYLQNYWELRPQIFVTF